MANKPIVLTIGVFDGVHRGHQALLRATVAMARPMGAVPAALTFEDHPMHVVGGEPRIPFLLPRTETFRILREKGIRRLRVLRFTRSFSRKSPVEFTRWLAGLGALKGVVVGKGFRFGKGASGDVDLLRRLGREQGFRVKAVGPVRSGGKTVSSSLIRRLLREGRTRQANRMLGRPTTIEGEVVHGKHVGHKIGFPTANLRRVPQFLPKDGVYACAVRLGGRYYRAGMNLGKRPTFRDDDHHRQAEVHILHYHGKLYGRRMKVYLLEYLRPERKFPGPAALVRQIKKDLARVRKCSLKGLK